MIAKALARLLGYKQIAKVWFMPKEASKPPQTASGPSSRIKRLHRARPDRQRSKARDPSRVFVSSRVCLGQSGLTQLRGKSWPSSSIRHAKETALLEVATGFRFYVIATAWCAHLPDVIYEIANHLLESWRSSRKANGPVQRENKADARSIDFFEGADQSLSGQGNLGDAPQRLRARTATRARLR